MPDREDINTALKSALFVSCNDTYLFSEDETQLISAEYLVTVNAAKAVSDLNSTVGNPYKIFLENKTSKFATSCPPVMKAKKAKNRFGFVEHIMNTWQETTRRGKIDIAVYRSEQWGKAPVCAIEVKGFKPSQKEVQKDLSRNAEYFTISSPSGKSRLDFTSFISLHHYRRTYNVEKENRNLIKIKKLYENYVKSISLDQGVHSEIDAFTIRRGLVPDSDHPDFNNFMLDGSEDYHFIGIIVCFYRS